MGFVSTRFKSPRIYWALLVPTQIVLFVSLHELGIRLYLNWGGNILTDIGWGLFVRFVLYVYISTVVIVGGVGVLFRGRAMLQFLLVEALVVVIVCFSQLHYRPYRTFLLTVTAVAGILLPFVVFELILRVRNINDEN